MRRRQFITLLGGAAAWPLAARAQQAVMPVVGFLRSTTAASASHLVSAFRRGLNETGFVEGQNVAIEYRWADDQHDRLAGLTTDLIRRQVGVIVGNIASVRAAKAATSTIPIVFVIGSDPVRTGLVANLNRPGGNVTGVVFTTVDLTAKRLGLLHELLPEAALIAVLFDPNAPEAELQARAVEEAGRTIGRKIMIMKAASDHEFNGAFATIVQAGAAGLLIGGGPFLLSRRRQLAVLAARHTLPTIGITRSFAEAGVLMSYGASQTDAYRRAGEYAGRILKGANPGDLPVELASKFDLIINLATAKGMGFEIPPMLLATADEVIE